MKFLPLFLSFIHHSMLDVRCSMFIRPLGTPLPGLHHGLDKVKFPILTIAPQHGCLFWHLATVQQSLWFAPKTQAAFLQDHTFASSSFSSITIRYSILVFLFIIRCWTFDVRCSVFSVRPGQKQLSAYGIERKGAHTRVLLKTDNGPWLLECQLSKSSTISNSFLLVTAGKPRLFNSALRAINVP